MRMHRTWSIALVAFGSIAAAGSAWADDAKQSGGEQTGEEAAVEVPPHAVTAPAWDTLNLEANGARIEKVALANEEGRTVYEATVLTTGGDRYKIVVDIDGKLIDKELEEER